MQTKVHLVKAMVFPVVRYGGESWTIKKAERQTVDAFELWCRSTLQSPLVCKTMQPVNPEGNQSWIFIGGGLMLKLKLQYFGHLMQRTDLFEKTPLLGNTEAEGDDRGWDGWKTSLTQWTWVWAICRSWWWTGKPGVLQSMGLQRVGHDWVTELNWIIHCVYLPQLLYPFICRWTYRSLPCSS